MDSVNAVSQAISDTQTLISTQTHMQTQSQTQVNAISNAKSDLKNSQIPVKRSAASMESGDISVTVNKSKRSKTSGVKGKKKKGMLSDPSSDSSLAASETQFPHTTGEIVMEIPSSDATLGPSSSFPIASPTFHSSPVRDALRHADLNVLPSTTVPTPRGQGRNTRSTISDAQKKQPGRVTRQSSTKVIAASMEGESSSLCKDTISVRQLSKERTKLSTEITGAELRDEGLATGAGSNHNEGQPLLRSEWEREPVLRELDKAGEVITGDRPTETPGKFSGEEGVPVQRVHEGGERRTDDELDKFGVLAQKEEDEGEVSLDMSFIWGSLPDESFSSDV